MPASASQIGKDPGTAFPVARYGKIVLYDDSQPYSFFFEEYTPYGRGICGAVILHGIEDIAKARYSVHT